MQPLRLFALDAEDLAIVSAHVQDAVGRVGDMAFLPAERRFALIVNRFDWLDAPNDEPPAARRAYRRRRTALHFDRVLGARTRGLPRRDGDRIVNLLAIRFEETDAPAGTVELVFSGDATIRLEVECIEARLSDLGAAWATDNLPHHNVAEGEAETAATGLAETTSG